MGDGSRLLFFFFFDQDFLSPPAENKTSETPELGIMRNVGSLPLLSRYPNSGICGVGSCVLICINLE